MLTIDGVIFSLQRHGGISVYFHELLRHLAAERIDAECLLEMPARQTVAEQGTVAITARPARTLERYRHCRTPAHAGIVHSSYYRLPDRRDVLTVVTVYDFVYERWQRGPRMWAHRWQKNAAIRGADAVICISRSTHDDLLEFVGDVPGQQRYVIHCGVSDVFRVQAAEPAPVPYVLFVGQRGGYKNFQQLLAAMEYLPDLELVCVGGGPLVPAELAGAAQSVRARVRHEGLVNDEALNTLYGQAVCLVYPSLYEGFGIPVAEAMRAGCPVVARECRAVLEVGGDALTVVPDADPRGMAEAVRATMSGRPALVQRGIEQARQYSWREAHRKTVQVYRALAQAHGLDSSMFAAGELQEAGR